jgi:DNA-binding IclR family transcriptional regulator
MSTRQEFDTPQIHRTVDRVTRIVEEVVYNPGMTFTEIVRAVGAAKSSVHGFIQGLIASGWLFEDDGRYYLGPAVYGLTLASGNIRAGVASHEDLEELHQKCGLAVFLGVRAGDHLIYISEAGQDTASSFAARFNIRRTLIDTAGGKVLLSCLTDSALQAFLRRCPETESDTVNRFINALADIRRTGLATNYTRGGIRFAVAAVVRNRSGEAVASLTVVGPTQEVEPRLDMLSQMLLDKAQELEGRLTAAREPI